MWHVMKPNQTNKGYPSSETVDDTLWAGANLSTIMRFSVKMISNGRESVCFFVVVFCCCFFFFFFFCFL